MATMRRVISVNNVSSSLSSAWPPWPLGYDWFELPAFGRRHVIAGIPLGRGIRGQAPHDLVAQSAVEVQAELDLG